MLLLDMMSHMLPSASSNMLQHPGSDPGGAASSREHAAHECEDEHVVLLFDQHHQRPGTPRKSHQAGGHKGAAAAAAAAGSADRAAGVAAHEQRRQVAAASSSGGSSVRMPTPAGHDTASASGSKLAAGSSREDTITQWLRDPSQQALLGLLLHAGETVLQDSANLQTLHMKRHQLHLL